MNWESPAMTLRRNLSIDDIESHLYGRACTHTKIDDIAWMSRTFTWWSQYRHAFGDPKQETSSPNFGNWPVRFDLQVAVDRPSCRFLPAIFGVVRVPCAWASVGCVRRFLLEQRKEMIA